jgi:HSP20 family protein
MTLVKRNGRRSEIVPSIWNNFFNNDLFNWDSNFADSGTSIPAVNIKEKSDSFIVEMAAPGIEKKDFKIELDGSALTISSERQNESEEKDGEDYNRKEFSYQSFYRTFHLPKEVVNADKIEAKYENGLLRLEIPKREEAKQKPARLIDVH